jgi:hypothetical protein
MEEAMAKHDQDKTFDAVAWVRAVRDELHRTYKDLPTREFVRTLSKQGDESAFGKRIAQKFKQADPATKSTS